MAKQAIRRAFFPARLLRDLEAMRLNQGKLLAALNRERPVQPLRDCEFSVFSQFGEDGILQRLIGALPIKHQTFIEFGVEDFVESNCRFLMMNDNWRGYVVDGSERHIQALQRADWWWKHELRASCTMLTRENVDACLRASGFDADLGVLSADVDGNDYWLLEAITSFTPRILITEYNSLFGAERAISVPYHPSFSKRQQHYSDLYFGASLPALCHLATARGYSLVGTTSSGVNAFFVRNDILGSLVPLSPQEAFVETMVRQSRDREGRLDFLTLAERQRAIAGLPVVNVRTGELETL